MTIIGGKKVFSQKNGNRMIQFCTIIDILAVLLVIPCALVLFAETNALLFLTILKINVGDYLGVMARANHTPWMSVLIFMLMIGASILVTSFYVKTRLVKNCILEQHKELIMSKLITHYTKIGKIFLFIIFCYIVLAFSTNFLSLILDKIT